jgi:hypothetical protein
LRQELPDAVEHDGRSLAVGLADDLDLARQNLWEQLGNNELIEHRGVQVRSLLGVHEPVDDMPRPLDPVHRAGPA